MPYSNKNIKSSELFSVLQQLFVIFIIKINFLLFFSTDILKIWLLLLLDNKNYHELSLPTNSPALQNKLIKNYKKTTKSLKGLKFHLLGSLPMLKGTKFILLFFYLFITNFLLTTVAHKNIGILKSNTFTIFHLG